MTSNVPEVTAARLRALQAADRERDAANSPEEIAYYRARKAFVLQTPCRQCGALPGRPCSGRPKTFVPVWGTRGEDIKVHRTRCAAMESALKDGSHR